MFRQNTYSDVVALSSGVWGSERLAQMSCWVLASSMRRLPAAMRQWWTEAEHRFYPLVEHVTTTYISRDLIAEELKAIQTHEKKFENMTVCTLVVISPLNNISVACSVRTFSFSVSFTIVFYCKTGNKFY